MSEYIRIRRVLKIPCPDCFGSGFQATKHGPVRCPECKGSGDVERVVNEIVTDEQEQEGGTA